MTNYSHLITDYVDFPNKEVIFRDISPLLNDMPMFSKCVDEIIEASNKYGFNKIAAIDSRGFILGMAVSIKTNMPFIMVRKAGKLPGKVLNLNYNLEYGQASLEIQEKAFTAGDGVILCDDLLGSGGTAEAAIKLIEQTKAKVVCSAFIIELTYLGGSKRLTTPIVSVLKY